MELTSDDVFSAPYPMTETTSEFQTYKPEGISPERWRRIRTRRGSLEVQSETGQTNMIELNNFIKEQINEAISGIKESMQIKSNNVNIKRSKIKDVKNIKPRITEVKKVNMDIRRRWPGLESEAGHLDREDASWTDVAARPQSLKNKNTFNNARTKAVTASLGKKQKVRIPRLAAVAIHCRNKEDYPKILSEAKLFAMQRE